ncbi:TRAP transporter, DctM subunit [Sulfurivirga caldicuralii]|uniref:TRAP transporter large permease protein n=1 Tax=Sulfurivirga caldicuralii TaxID=364032 RepID=A0A1N6DII5_9GAMM|nr:TRAP transporter large permease subunit [Sulfurivirga caldicuralii]SIN70494.1 TRAP transporter, DctM subunit [Sulfurivirga caldicuralii]
MAWLALLLFVVIFLALLLGFPVAFTLGGASLLFALLATALGAFDMAFLQSIPNRIFAIMNNETLLAVPLFVLMGLILEKTRIADELLSTLGELLNNVRGGLALAVILVGMLLAASTGIVGATVVAMGVLALPAMLRQGYDPRLASGVITASGTLGQIIPPSIVLILLGDVISNAYQQAQLAQGLFSPEPVSVGDLFAGAFIPGLLLVVLYMAYVVLMSFIRPERLPVRHKVEITPLLIRRVFTAMLPPLLLIVVVLGSILAGFATPTESAALGAFGALVLGIVKRELTLKRLQAVMRDTLTTTSMIFMIFIGAAFFSLVFRGLGGDDVVREWLHQLPGGATTALVVVLLLLFVLGFFLDFIEITYVVVPVVGPILLMMGMDPVWLGVMIAMVLQTSFLTPPFGFALFYLRGVAPKEVKTEHIYAGAIPFIGLQLLMLAILWLWPQLVTWLPKLLYGG